MDTRLKTQPQRDDYLKSKERLKKLHNRLRGGHVLRYHTRPEIMDGQNVAAHTWRTMVILNTLWPNTTKDCLLKMLYHDIAESETGDVPATTKWKYPELEKILVNIEQDHEKSLGVGDNNYLLINEERLKCDVADKLELVFHCYRLMQQGNTLAHDVFVKGTEYLQKKYRGQKFFEPVQEILDDLTTEHQKSRRLQTILARV